MKKNYAIITIMIVVSLITIIVIINTKERRKIKQDNTNDVMLNNMQGANEIISLNYNGKILQITKKEDVNIIKNILSNLKFDKPSSDGMISFIITMNDENYCFKNQGKTVTKGENGEGYLSDEDAKKILDILNKY